MGEIFLVPSTYRMHAFENLGLMYNISSNALSQEVQGQISSAPSVWVLKLQSFTPQVYLSQIPHREDIICSVLAVFSFKLWYFSSPYIFSSLNLKLLINVMFLCAIVYLTFLAIWAKQDLISAQSTVLLKAENLMIIISGQKSIYLQQQLNNWEPLLK